MPSQMSGSTKYPFFNTLLIYGISVGERDFFFISLEGWPKFEIRILKLGICPPTRKEVAARAVREYIGIVGSQF
jgi:hypothetical protein